MSLSKLVKREILITIISVAVLIAFFSLFTYAYYMDIKETGLNTLKFGDLTLEFCADATCDSTIENIGRVIGTDENGDPYLMYPQSELQALETVPYIFKVTNNSSYKQNVTVKLSKQETPSLNEKYINYKEIDTNYLYTSFGEVGLASNTAIYSTINEILGSYTIESGESKTFNLWLWIKSDSPNTVQGSYFIGDISLTGEYEVEKFKWYNACKGNNTLACKIITNNTPKSDENINFAYTSEGCNNFISSGNICSASDINQITNGLYYTADATVDKYGEDGERIYYYRGDVDNNWVSFGGYKWRIVRTTSEGGVKLVYSGDGLTESSGFITSAAYSTDGIDDRNYVVSSSDGTLTDSNAKKVIDAWYSGSTTTGTECGGSACNFSTISNKLSDTTYSSFISESAIYCYNRIKTIEQISGSSASVGSYYQAQHRLYMNNRPSFACPYEDDSRYTVDETTGNGYLTYPIALLSADEIWYSGLNAMTKNSTGYITDNSTSNSWWNFLYLGFMTMNGSTANPPMSTVNTSLYISETQYSDLLGIRPSITLKSCVTAAGTGNGTFDSPFELSNNNCN